MYLDKSDHDIAWLIDRISRQDLDLQPNFQRGQVWSEHKKKRLIDSVLRNWYIPPIHVVVNDTLDKEEVLDGQQRLRAIYEFANNEFTVDGRLEPFNDQIDKLDGLYYSELPRETQSKFKRFIITTVRLKDYKPSEPGELFFRLNQITSLTSAEQRNSLIGPARDQIRKLSEYLEDRAEGISIGFTNSRMNYDDIISRVALTLELGKLTEKLTSTKLESRYRSSEEFSASIISRIEKGIIKFTCALQENQHSLKFNKPTLYSWLIFIIGGNYPNEEPHIQNLADFLAGFEAARVKSNNFYGLTGKAKSISAKIQNEGFELIELFNERSSTRVNDSSSVIMRDFCLTASAHWYGPSSFSMDSNNPEKIGMLNYMRPICQFSNKRELATQVDNSLIKVRWGNKI